MRWTLLTLLGVAGCCSPSDGYNPMLTIHLTGSTFYVIEVNEDFWVDSTIFESRGRATPISPDNPLLETDRPGIVGTTRSSVNGLQWLLRLVAQPDNGIALIAVRSAGLVDGGWREVALVGNAEHPKFRARVRTIQPKTHEDLEIDYTLFRRDSGEGEEKILDGRTRLLPFGSIVTGYITESRRHYLIVLLVASVKV